MMKFQMSSTKLQITPKFQRTNLKLFGISILEFVIYLEFGICDLVL